MKVNFREMNQDMYFSEIIFPNKKNKSSLRKDAIYIGAFDGEYRDESIKFKNNLPMTNVPSEAFIYFHQKGKDDFNSNCKLLIDTLKYLKGYTEVKVVIITVISDHYNYYYRELYSLLYMDTMTNKKFKTSASKIIMKILVKTYFGYRIMNVARALYYSLRRLIRIK